MKSNQHIAEKPSLYTTFLAITKSRLSISVVVSTLAGYALGVEHWTSHSWLLLLYLAVGGYCMVGASNVFNQVIEKDLDAKMERTKNRPVPLGTISVTNALVLGFVLTLIGLVILYLVNPKTAMFGAISIFMYVCLYTPLKTVTPLAVFVGAFPELSRLCWVG